MREYVRAAERALRHASALRLTGVSVVARVKVAADIRAGRGVRGVHPVRRASVCIQQVLVWHNQDVRLTAGGVSVIVPVVKPANPPINAVDGPVIAHEHVAERARSDFLPLRRRDGTSEVFPAVNAVVVPRVALVCAVVVENIRADLPKILCCQPASPSIRMYTANGRLR